MKMVAIYFILEFNRVLSGSHIPLPTTRNLSSIYAYFWFTHTQLSGLSKDSGYNTKLLRTHTY